MRDFKYVFGSALLHMYLDLKGSETDVDGISFHCFSAKIRLDVSSESSARQRTHMKNRALMSSKDKSKKFKCRLLHFFDWRFKVNTGGEQKEEPES